MRRRVFDFFGLAAVIVLIIGWEARADVGPPVTMRLVKELAHPAIPGESFEAALDVFVGEAGILEDFRIDGVGWQDLEIDAANTIRANAGSVLQFMVSGTPGWGAQRVRIGFIFNDRPVFREFDFSEERFARSWKPGRVSSIDDTGRITPFRPRHLGASNTADSQQIRFHGRIAFQRPLAPNGSPITVGGDNVYFEIKDDDPPPSDDTIYAGYTDPFGNFDVTVDWSDCDITGCDVPDIYIRWELDDPIVSVQHSDLLEEDYSWSTEDNVINDFGGSEVDFGTLMPADSSEFPAIQIHNSIVRAHRYILALDGSDVPHVDAKWADGSTGAFYNPTFEEIHISSGEQWTEGTHVHEYGHHFMENFSQNLTPDYCNGYCDGSAPCTSGNNCDNPGHCAWCPETNHDAWNEGWPDWLGAIVTSTFLQDYGLTPYSINDSRYTLESTKACCQDGSTGSEYITSGYISALLWDMVDNNPALPALLEGQTAASDCQCDAMSIGVKPIFAVVRLDQPTNPADFIRMFWNRYPEYHQDFWSTVTNIFPLPVPGMDFSPEPPIILSQPEGCQTFQAPEPILLSVQGNGSLLQYQWRKNFVPLAELGTASGTQTSTLTISPSSPADGGIYDCVVATCGNSLSTNSVPFRVSVYNARGSGTKSGAWGVGSAGQLGRGQPLALPSPYPSPMLGLTQAASIAQGPTAQHALALNADGSVWSWGDNTFQQLGRTVVFTGDAATPQPVPSIHDIVAVAAGGSTSYVLNADGNILTWGGNQHGERGPGVPIYSTTPNTIEGLDCIVSIAAGAGHCAAVRSDGAVFTWGRNNRGQLGYLTNDPEYSDTPMQVPGITDSVAVAAGIGHTLVLRSNGTVLAFGQNDHGQLGDGTIGNQRATPMAVLGLTGVAAVRAGQASSFAILQDGTIRGWGDDQGELGSGSSIFSGRATPVPTVDVGPVLDLASGSLHTLFLRADHTVWVSGSNQFGQLGPPPLLGTTRPLKVVGIANAIAVGAASNTSYVLAPGIAPQLSLDQSNTIRVAGQSASLSVTVYGSEPFTYQWMHNDEAVLDGNGIVGAATRMITFDPVQHDEDGEYRLTVTNAFGSTTSDAMFLIVNCARGDVDCNGRIDAEDMAGFLQCVGGPGVNSPPAGCIAPDFTVLDLDRDGDVDLGDFALFMNCFSGANQPIGPECANP